MSGPGIMNNVQYSVAIDVYCTQAQQGFNSNGTMIPQNSVTNITSNTQSSWFNITTPTPPLGAVSGCTDPTAFNYNPLANNDDGSCIATVLGCTNSSAYNYAAAANTDDGSCTYQGCTTPGGCGYAPIFTVLCCIICDGSDDNYCCECGDDSGNALNYGGVASGCTTNCIYGTEIPAANVSVTFEAGELASPTTLASSIPFQGVSTNFTITIPANFPQMQYLTGISMELVDANDNTLYGGVPITIPSNLQAGDTFTAMNANYGIYMTIGGSGSTIEGVGANTDYNLKVRAAYTTLYSGQTSITSTDSITFNTDI